MARRPVTGDRPAEYPDKTALAAELCISESTVEDWVKRGLLPKPIADPPWRICSLVLAGCGFTAERCHDAGS